MVTVSEALQIALEHQQAGRQPEADSVYRQILDIEPENVNALHLLGLSAQRQGRLDEATELIRRAVDTGIEAPQLYHSLGAVYLAQGAYLSALGWLERALALKPDYAEACVTLGRWHQAQGRWAEAGARLRQAIEFNPNMAEAYLYLGLGQQSQQDRSAAVSSYRRAIELQPESAPAHAQLATVLHESGQLNESLAAYHRSLELEPRNALAWSNMATLLKQLGHEAQAEACYRQALAHQPNDTRLHFNYANFCKDRYQRETAEAHYRRALELDARFHPAATNLGKLLQDQGRLNEARQLFEYAIQIAPQDDLAYDNLLMNELYQPETSLDRLHDLAQHWCRTRQLERLQAGARHPQVPDRERPLRIGIVSADLGDHPIGRLLTRILGGLDPARYGVCCYSNRPLRDALSERLKRSCGGWRDIQDATDDSIAAQVREDAIDILIDLSGHTAGNRLSVFARRPAPVQVTWMGYPGTTGLPQIDWLIADPWLIPPEYDRLYSEKIWRLPECAACYEPPNDAPEVQPPPCIERGTIMLSCFNNPIKITLPAMQAWGRILRELDGARLVFKYQGLLDPATQNSLRERLSAAGVDLAQVEFQGASPIAQLLAEYHQVDLALDPFPYTGATSSMLALWMGVPVVSLRGQTMASRQSLSVLGNAGLPELVAHDVDEYVALALSLAKDRERLSTLRQELRPRMQASALCQPARFMPAFETALRGMWGHWCDAQT